MRLQVSDGTHDIEVTLFDQAIYLLKCHAQTYIDSITKVSYRYNRFNYIYIVISNYNSTKQNNMQTGKRQTQERILQKIGVVPR